MEALRLGRDARDQAEGWGRSPQTRPFSLAAMCGSTLTVNFASPRRPSASTAVTLPLAGSRCVVGGAVNSSVGVPCPVSFSSRGPLSCRHSTRGAPV